MTSAPSVVQRISVKNVVASQRSKVMSLSTCASVKHRLANQDPTRLNSALNALRRASLHHRRGPGMSLSQKWHLVHRVAIGVAAVLYCVVALDGAAEALKFMRAHQNPMVDFVAYPTPLIGDIVGTTTIAASPLMQVLDSDTAPRSATIYLDRMESSDSQDEQPPLTTSFTGCASLNSVDSVYANAFLRSMYAALVRDTAYNLTFLSESQSELIAPVVDCMSAARMFEDSSVVKVFFLVRNRQPQPHLLGADRIGLVSLSLSNQGFQVPSRDERGSAGVATLALLYSLEDTTVTHHFVIALGYPYEPLRFQAYEYVNTTADAYWTLRSVPRDRATEVSRTLLTASRTGFYYGKETEQANIKNELWLLPSDPLDVVSTMHWVGRAVLSDTWAWTHLVHMLLGCDVIVQVLILLLVVYRNWQQGTIWIGDAFMGISKSLPVRGLLVLASWYLNGRWSLTEYLYHVGNRISEVEEVYVYSGIVRADLMTVYLAVVDLIAKAAREQLDPAATLFLFFATFQYTPALLALCQPLVDIVADKTLRDYQMGVVQTDEDLSIVTPMRLWNAHPVGASEASFTFAVMAPLLLSLGLIFAFLLAVKLRRRCTRTSPRSSAIVEPFNSSTGHSGETPSEASSRVGSAIATMFSVGVSSTPSTSTTTAASSNRTRFEIATGVELAHQFGLRCHYDNVRTIKGLRFVSADGVYSNGFVVANAKFLVATEDVLAILLIKLLRFRYRNVYVYDVDGGHRVQQMARLVYPQTLSLRDLAHLNITTLA